MKNMTRRQESPTPGKVCKIKMKRDREGYGEKMHSKMEGQRFIRK